MPRVPTYEGGQVRPTVQPNVQQSDYGANPRDFGASYGEGLQAAGRGLLHVYEQEKQRADQTALLGYEVEATRNESELLNDPEHGALATRGLDAMNARDKTLQAWDERDQAALLKLPASAQLRAKVIGAGRRASIVDSLSRHALTESERYTDSQADALVDLATNEVGTNYNDPERISAGLANIEAATKTRFRGQSPEQQTAMVQAYQSRALSTAVQQVLLQQGPTAARERIKTYAPLLTGDHRLMLETRIQNEEEHLASRAATEAAKRQTQAEHAVTFMEDAASTGIPLDPDTLFEKAGAVRGTDQEQPFAAAVARMNEVAQVRTRPFAEQQQYIAQLEATLQQGSPDPKKDKTRLDTLRSALESQRKLAKDSPILFWQNQGGSPVEPVNFQLGAAGIESALAGRFVQLDAMRKRFGPDVSSNPWRPEEADALRQWIAKPERTNDDKLRLIAAVTKVAPNSQAFRDTLSPLAMTDRVTYLAGVEQYAKHEGGRNGPVAPIILNGARVLADKSIAMPPEAKFQAEFDKEAGSAYPPGSQERADAYTRYKTIYAGLSEHISPTARQDAKDAEGGLDETLRKTALNLATGGIIEINGRQVPKPWGVDDDAFRDRLTTQLGAIATATGFPAKQLGDMPLMAVPGHEGMYFLLNQGRVQVDPATNKPVLVRP